MVGGTPKPFACTNEGCTMTFTNEDHLNVHQRKHEMVLNLGIKNSNIVADQTPTPTRFLRNCEEVGLFQDLQNVNPSAVNPFEETFRRAAELVKTGSLPEPDLPEDDTLHTPHVFPHLPEENVSCIYTSQKIDKISLTTDGVVDLTADSIHTVTDEKILSPINDKNTLLVTVKSPLTTDHLTHSPDHIYAVSPIRLGKEELFISHKNTPKVITSQIKHKRNRLTSKLELSTKLHIVSREKQFHTIKAKTSKSANSNSKTTNNAAKQKLQQKLLHTNIKENKTIENKDNNPHQVIVLQVDNSDKLTQPNSSTVPVLRKVTKSAIFPKFETICENNLDSTDNNNVTLQKRKNNLDKLGFPLDTEKLDYLERNRAAAARCREKKKKWIDALEGRYENVCKENMELQKENSKLKFEIMHLKTLLLAHKECPVTKAMTLGQNIPIGPAHIIINENQDNKNTSSK